MSFEKIGDYFSNKSVTGTFKWNCSKGKLVWICTTYPTTDKLIFSKSRNGAKQNAASLNNKASPDEKTKP